MTIDVAELRELHYQYDPGFEHTPVYCFSCMDNVMDVADAEWPCPTTELLDAYEELHRYDADMEAGGDWLPLHLREAVAGLEPEQRVVVTEWYWRTSLLIGALQTERDRLRVMLKEIGNQAANINHHCYQTGKLQCVACASSQELIEELARAALEGRE